MDKTIEKTSLPIFYNEEKEPLAAIMFIDRKRVIYMMKPASEEEIINLYQQDKKIKRHAENNHEKD